MKDEKLTFIEHLEELRAGIIKSVVFIVILSIAIYSFKDKVLFFLMQPIDRALIFISPQEAFITNIKIALFGGLFLSSPFILYQIWAFISKGLGKNERIYVAIFAPVSFIFFLLGTAFGYFIIVPIGMRFLLSFATDFVVPMITVSKYISFVAVLTFLFGVVFELPLLMLFLAKIGIVTPDFLRKRRRHAIVIIFIIAAILTPPDIVTQCLMAGPLIVLYELGILFSLQGKKKKASPEGHYT